MSLLTPLSIAVIGASSQEGKVGHDILKNLIREDFAGAIYPVNIKGGEILGKKALTSVKEIQETVDLAVIVIPAALVNGALIECGEKGVKNVIVISAGFAETHTEEGKKLEAELIATAKKYEMNLVGPNCLGLVRPHIRMNASFAKELPPAGSIALISQSGATAVALMDMAPTLGLGFSMVASIGNKSVMDECDFLELCEKDEHTKVIAFYLESIKDGLRFREIAARVKKPIVLLKSGTSVHGGKAAASHTGALAGNDAAIDALCKETGIHRAHSSDELIDLVSVLSNEPALLTNRIAIVTNAGGLGILATDAAEHAKLSLPALTETIAAKLKADLPPAASVANPIDVLGDAPADRYKAALVACREDRHIDGVVVLLTPQVMTPCMQIAQTIIETMKSAPLMPITVCFMGGESVRDAVALLRKNMIPCFPSPERAVAAMGSLMNGRHPELAERVTKPHMVRQAHHDVVELLKGKSGLLDEPTTEKLFTHYGLPLPMQALATNVDEAMKIAERIGYPLIAKISSKDILHKTDIGGVRANIKNKEDVISAWNEIMENTMKNAASAEINGILIQQFLPAGEEFIVGAMHDPSFGPLIMAGLGGIYTELFADTSFRIAPVSSQSAYEMLHELTAWQLLLGMRGKPQADIDALAVLIEKVSRMMLECPQIKELDLNPVLVSHASVIIADAKVVLE